MGLDQRGNRSQHLTGDEARDAAPRNRSPSDDQSAAQTGIRPNSHCKITIKMLGVRADPVQVAVEPAA